MSNAFSRTVYESRHGSPAYDKLCAEVDAAVARITGRNQAIAQVLRAAADTLAAMGDPGAYLARGYDHKDAVSLLWEIMPTCDPEAVEGLRQSLMDKAYAGEML